MKSKSTLAAWLAACAGAATGASFRVPMTQAGVVARIGVDSEIDARVSALVNESSGGIAASTYGKSRDGRTLHLLRLGDENKPALLIVAGLNAQHRVGIETALGVAKKLAADKADLLTKYCVYVMPCADPDGIERERSLSPKRDGAHAPAEHDDDADARVNEDGPVDLNGDGFISVMRVPDPPPEYNLDVSEMLDPSDARLTKRPDRTKGERATYAIVTEGKDQDGDGRIAEDGTDGTDLSRNFPYRWPEFQDGAGTSALCEPETRAIAEWLMEKPNVVSVLLFGPNDNLINAPEVGKFDPSGRVPLGLENDDKSAWDEVSRLFKDATGMTGAPAGDPSGSLHGWAYAHLGLWSFSTPVWVRPDLVKKEDAPAPGAERPRGEGNAPSGGERAGGGAAGATPAAPGAMSDAEIQTMIGEFQSATPEKRREMMARAMSLPQDVQDKLRAAAMAAFAGRGAPEVAPAPAAQPAATAPSAPAQPAAGGQPDGPRGPRGGGAGGGGRGARGGGGGGGGRGPGGPGGGPGGAGGGDAARPAPSDADDAKWLKYSDDKREKSGFIEFKPFDHPQLGKVEIGGFVPGFKFNPPDAEFPALVDQQTKFVAALLDKLPRLTVDDPVVEDLGGGIWRVSVKVTNDGYLPTRSAIGMKARRLPPLRIVIDVPEDSVVSGERTVRSTTLAGSGASRVAEWVIAQPENAAVKVSIRSAELGNQELSILMKATARKQKVPETAAPPPPPAPPPDAKPPEPAPADAAPKPLEEKPAPKDPQEGGR